MTAREKAEYVRERATGMTLTVQRADGQGVLLLHANRADIGLPSNPADKRVGLRVIFETLYSDDVPEPVM